MHFFFLNCGEWLQRIYPLSSGLQRASTPWRAVYVTVFQICGAPTIRLEIYHSSIDPAKCSIGTARIYKNGKEIFQ